MSKSDADFRILGGDLNVDPVASIQSFLATLYSMMRHYRPCKQLFEIFTRTNTNVTILAPKHNNMMNTTQGDSEHTLDCQYLLLAALRPGVANILLFATH